jgi:hypothetical protein
MMDRAQTIKDGASFAALLAAPDGRGSALRQAALTGHRENPLNINDLRILMRVGTKPHAQARAQMTRGPRTLI